MKNIFKCSILFSLMLLQSCSLIQMEKKIEKRDDPLIGKIIQAETGNEISFETLVRQIRDADVIYLSEKHDNPDQHQAQERIIQALADSDRIGALGFEFFSVWHTPDLLNFIDSGAGTHSGGDLKFIEQDLRKKLGWDHQTDTQWAFYYALLSLARKNQIPAAGLDLPESLKKRILRKGVEDLNPFETELIFSSGYQNSVYEAYMRNIFKQVHCGMDHGNMTLRLYETWSARNDRMGHSIARLAAQTDCPVVVIIGGGHTEYGLGVIDRVRAIDPELIQINIGLQEIYVAPADKSEYLEPLDLEGFAPAPPSDYLWFTQRVSYEDPCEQFRKEFGKMQPGKKAGHHDDQK